MTHPIGVPSTQLANGDWVGTTPQHIRRAIGSMYMAPGILPGPQTRFGARGTSGWSYSIPECTAFMWYDEANREGVLVPVDAGTISVSPSTGGRTDLIYVSLDGSVKVAEGATNRPEPGVTIDRMVIPSGATNTQGAVSNWDMRYAVPAGASLGRLVNYTIPGATWSQANATSDHVMHTARFVVPTDRLVRIELSTSVQSVSSAGGHAAIGVEIDGTYRRAVHMSYDGRQETNSGVWTTEVAEGAHTLTVFCMKFAGANFKTSGSASSSQVALWDAGVDR